MRHPFPVVNSDWFATNDGNDSKKVYQYIFEKLLHLFLFTGQRGVLEADLEIVVDPGN